VAIARGTGLISDIGAAPAFAVGVAAGPVLWFWILLAILARHAETLRPEKLEKIEKVLPVILLIMACIILAQALIPYMK
jgi:arginine exporter protein ArgO